MKSIKSTLQLAALFLLTAGSLTLLTACGGGGATLHTTGDKTLGQELQDLQQAHDKGIVTDKEYEKARKDLIEKYTAH